ncbi:ABC transporter permease [Okibacterium endophyticum]
MTTTEVSAARRAPSPRTPARSRRSLGISIATFGLPVILVVEIIAFGILSPDTFLTLNTLQTIATNQAVAGVLAIAVLFPLVVGEFDLSVGSNLGLGAILVVGLSANNGLPLWVSLLISLTACSLIGVVNGLLVTKVGVNSFVTTLGVQSALAGAVLWYTNGNVIYSNVPPELSAMGSGTLFGAPYSVIALIFVALIAFYILDQTPFGRFLYAVGGSKEASRLSGLNVNRLTMLAFVIAGLLAGVAGVMLSAKLGSGNPTVGASFLLPGFAAAFLGATAFRPGSFNVWGTVFAVFVIATGIYGLNVLGVPFFIEPIFTGAVLVFAVAATRYLRKERIA